MLLRLALLRGFGLLRGGRFALRFLRLRRGSFRLSLLLRGLLLLDSISLRSGLRLPSKPALLSLTNPRETSSFEWFYSLQYSMNPLPRVQIPKFNIAK